MKNLAQGLAARLQMLVTAAHQDGAALELDAVHHLRRQVHWLAGAVIEPPQPVLYAVHLRAPVPAPSFYAIARLFGTDQLRYMLCAKVVRHIWAVSSDARC